MFWASNADEILKFLKLHVRGEPERTGAEYCPIQYDWIKEIMNVSSWPLSHTEEAISQDSESHYVVITASGIRQTVRKISKPKKEKLRLGKDKSTEKRQFTPSTWTLQKNNNRPEKPYGWITI